MTLLSIAAAAFLAFSNGANDNFKGVASLYGSGVASYRSALTSAPLQTAAVNFAGLNKGFLAPLLLSPGVGIGLGGLTFLLVDRLRPLIAPRGEACVCVGLDGAEPGWPSMDGAAASARAAHPRLRVRPLPAEACAAETSGTIAALDVRRAFTGLHWVSAGAVSFTRGLNDTPKIASLLLIAR